MKKHTILIVVIFLITLCVVCLFLFKPNKKSPILGVWWWDDELDYSYLDFAKKNYITEIYLCTSKFNNSTNEFIKHANEKNIKVFWLAGEYQWIENNDLLKKQIEKFLYYQNKFENIFSGIHLDIEPHQHDQFKNKRTELITKFVNLVYSIRQEYPNIWIEYDLPFWLHDEILLNGQTKPAYEHILDNSNRVTLMSYRDTFEKIYEVSKEEIEYAIKTNKIINLGVATKSNEGDNVSFQEEGKEVMKQEIEKLRKIIPNNFGIAIHHIKSWFDLKQ